MNTTNTLSQAQHTPGPWIASCAENRASKTYGLISSSEGTIALTPNNWGDIDPRSNELNCCLIASAPDLLAALEAAQAALRTAAAHSENVLPDLATYCHAEATKAYDIFARAKQS